MTDDDDGYRRAIKSKSLVFCCVCSSSLCKMGNGHNLSKGMMIKYGHTRTFTTNYERRFSFLMSVYYDYAFVESSHQAKQENRV